jgi:NitT/TauT family transport system substrate-binding protein
MRVLAGLRFLTWIVWNANGVATTQIFQPDKSFGADGMVVKPGIASIKDLKGKKVAAGAPGTTTFFTLAWMLKKNGLTIKDVEVVNLRPSAPRCRSRPTPSMRRCSWPAAWW